MNPIIGRHEFVLLFETINSNPNGDPDSGNMPRIDPQTNHGIVTDVSVKRKIRDYVDSLEQEGRAIFIRAREPLNPKIAKACEVKELPSFKKENGGWKTDEAKKRSQEDIRLLQEWLCAQYFDVRTFGAVMSTGPNAGQVRGPVQIGFGRSIEPIFVREDTITRVADTDKEEGEMGRKYVVPYALYRVHGFISVNLAARTGFNQSDLQLLFEALVVMFEHTRSASRPEMTTRKLIVFKHQNAMGNAPAHSLFDRVKIGRNVAGEFRDVDDVGIGNYPPARKFSDYIVTIDQTNIPEGVEIIERV
jgi:CRISPR-associated protein Csd2